MKIQPSNDIKIEIENVQKLVLTANDIETYQKISRIIINSYITIKPQDNLVDATDYFGIDDVNDEKSPIIFIKHLPDALSFLFQKNIIDEAYKNELKKQLDEKKWENPKSPISTLFKEKPSSPPLSKKRSPREKVEESFKNLLEENSNNINEMSEEDLETFIQNVSLSFKKNLKTQMSHQIKSQ